MLMRVVVGDNLRYHRKSQKLSQQALGNKIEMTQNSISRIETYKQNVTIDMIDILCDGLDIDSFDLVIGTQDIPIAYFFSKSSLRKGIIKILYEYFMIVTELDDPEISERCVDTYGIGLTDHKDIKTMDVSTDRDFVKGLIELLNRLQLDPSQLNDIINDVLGEE